MFWSPPTSGYCLFNKVCAVFITASVLPSPEISIQILFLITVHFNTNELLSILYNASKNQLLAHFLNPISSFYPFHCVWHFTLGRDGCWTSAISWNSLSHSILFLICDMNTDEALWGSLLMGEKIMPFGENCWGENHLAQSSNYKSFHLQEMTQPLQHSVLSYLLIPMVWRHWCGVTMIGIDAMLLW